MKILYWIFYLVLWLKIIQQKPHGRLNNFVWEILNTLVWGKEKKNSGNYTSLIEYIMLKIFYA